MIVSVTLCLHLALNKQVTFPKDPPFEADIRKFEAQDEKNPPKPGGIVFVGSSSIRLWKTLEQDFPSYNVINRGFGGSKIEDSTRYCQRIVTKYKPKIIVFFAGTNDIADGKLAEQVLEDFRTFVLKVRTHEPNVQIVYLSITPAPARWAHIGEIRQANQLIQEWMKKRYMYFVDMQSAFLTPGGEPRPELFVEDKLHLNEKGYEVWKQELTPLLSRLWSAGLIRRSAVP